MLNTANVLSLLRVLVAPIMFFLLVNRDAEIFQGIHYTWLDYFAALLFVIASITDFFDGYIARNWNQMTRIGQVLDPLADKMLMLAGFIGLMMMDRADAWAIYLILIREFFITGLRVVIVADGKEVGASFLGKIKTVLQMIAIGFLLMNWPFANELLWASVIITLYSGYEYVRDYIYSCRC